MCVKFYFGSWSNSALIFSLSTSYLLCFLSTPSLSPSHPPPCSFSLSPIFFCIIKAQIPMLFLSACSSSLYVESFSSGTWLTKQGQCRGAVFGQQLQFVFLFLNINIFLIKSYVFFLGATSFVTFQHSSLWGEQEAKVSSCETNPSMTPCCFISVQLTGLAQTELITASSLSLISLHFQACFVLFFLGKASSLE